MASMLIFGLGYTAARLAGHLREMGWSVTGTRREAADGSIAFDDQNAVERAIKDASHVLSSVPPDKQGSDPVLDRYGDALLASDRRWTGYLSSTGVYGDTAGAWVDESAPIGSGRRKARSDADLRWQKFSDEMRIFRLPGIYGPGRSPLNRVQNGTAKRVDVPQQVFSRIHVDDICSAVIASFDGPVGVYNIADDLPAPQHEVIAHAAKLLDKPVPPLQPLEEAGLSDAAKAFYAENRRVANGRAKRQLGWEPQYSDYKAGLKSLLD